MGSRIALGLAVAVTALGSWVGGAHAATTIVASPTEFTYEPGPYVQGLGEVAIFDNSLASAYHDVTTVQRGPDGQALFASEMIVGGQASDPPTTQVSPVNGTQYLSAGTYPFYCTLHGEGMSGNLVIDGSSGKAVPRPSVRVTIVNQKLKRARKAGVKVKVKALTASRGVMVAANKGKVLLGVKRGLNFKAGQVRTFVIPLTKQGRKAIRKGKVVQVKVKATMPWGKPTNTARKLR